MILVQKETKVISFMKAKMEKEMPITASEKYDNAVIKQKQARRKGLVSWTEPEVELVHVSKERMAELRAELRKMDEEY